MQSMTGFGSREVEIAPFGKVSVELRSTNHKFLETVFHVPEGFLALEDKIKKEIEKKIQRGRLTCVITVTTTKASNVFINRPLLKNYVSALGSIKKQFGIKGEVGLDTLIHLPGVLSLGEQRLAKDGIWNQLKILANQALDELVKTRQKEGRATGIHLKNRASGLRSDLNFIRTRFRKALKEKLAEICSDEERASFIKNSDISEEIERLSFHIRNFRTKLFKKAPIGKELDFIAQEMQREANTLAAKTFDVNISARLVQVKSQIEKIREQVQNIE